MDRVEPMSDDTVIEMGKTSELPAPEVRDPNQALLSDDFDEKSHTLPRAIFTLTENVDTGYEEVLKEPKQYSKDSCGRCMSNIGASYGKCFDAFQSVTYHLSTLLCGWILALVWGCTLGAANFCIVWVCHPCIKLQFMCTRVFYLIQRAFVRASCDPYCESCALCLNSIGGRFNVKVAGAPEQTPMVRTA